MRVVKILLCCICVLSISLSAGQVRDVVSVRGQVDGVYHDIGQLYMNLHRNPELSLQEEQTAGILAERLRSLGFEVTTGVGGHGVVGLLRNGPGPTLMIRTDMDALPVEEKTGLPYASHARAKYASGSEVPVMHACGHDLHMAAWTGTAIIMARSKSQWSGTLMFVGQPAEERGVGAKAMLADGLFTRFPKPDFALAIHVHDAIPSGMVGITTGFPHANTDSVDITIFGRGGHGSRPHLTIDPIVIAARVVLAVQTVVARETDPFEPTVVTIGSIHAGSTHNVIPDEAKLQLTVRTFKPEVRERVLAAIKRIATAEAAAAGAPKAPAVEITAGTNATYNDPSFASRAAVPLRQSLGPENVLSTTPRLGGEDFSEYTSQGVPGLLLWVGAVEPARFEAAKNGAQILPTTHSALFAPDIERALPTAVLAETVIAFEILKRP